MSQGKSQPLIKGLVNYIVHQLHSHIPILFLLIPKFQSLLTTHLVDLCFTWELFDISKAYCLEKEILLHLLAF